MMTIIAASIAAVQTPPEWAPVAINSDGTSLYFVDRSSITADATHASAHIYVVTASTTIAPRVAYDCAAGQFRFLETSMPDKTAPDAGAWRPAAPSTPIHATMRYVCSGGRQTTSGFGDITVKAATPEAFARAFIARRAAGK